MADVLMLLPDFTLIALGAVLCRATPLNRPLWDAVERIVYHLLFPCLLFVAIARSPIQAGAMASLLAAGVAVSVLGIALATALGRWPGVDARRHASGAQAAYRFNTYVALALAERLAGAEGLAWVALLVAVCVPLVNVAAVWPLARHGGVGTWAALARNPLILAPLAGLAVNLSAWPLPDLAALTLQRIGAAALPLGLMAVGAGLSVGALRSGVGLAAALMAIRHAVLPAFAILMALMMGLPPAQQAVLVAFAAMPTASSAYVLAVRMGGDGPFVAGLVSLSTLIAMLGLPLALLALAHVRAAL